MAKPTNRVRKTPQNLRLDRTDVGILAALQKDARLSNKELAAHVGLAPSSCLERVRRLERAGVLLGTHALVAPEALGIQLQALVTIRLQSQSRKIVSAFSQHALSLPETVALYHLAGATDFQVHVAVRDVAHLRRLTLEAFGSRPDVAHIETALIFEHSTRAVLPEYLEP